MATAALSELRRLVELDEPARDALGARHTPGEIARQPATWRSTARTLALQRERLGLALGSVRERRLPLTLIGAGSSHYVGESVSAAWSKAWHCSVRALPSTELLTHADGNLPHGEQGFVSFSRSGASPEGVAVIERLLERFPHAPQLIVTCDASGPMATRFAAHEGVTVLVLGSVNDRGLAMTSSFSNLVVAAQGIVHFQDLERWTESVDNVARAGERLLASAPDALHALLQRGFSSACFLGSGPLRAVARESALKVLELSAGRIKTQSDSFLGVRHGPLSALDRETLLVGYLSSSARTRAYELDLLEEVREKRLCGAISLCAPENDDRARALSDVYLSSELPPELGDDQRPPLDVIVGQLLGLFAALKLGLQPDSPSPNGAITRVVAGVRLHE